MTLKGYYYQTLKEENPQTKFRDTVMAKAIAFQLFPWGENEINTLQVTKPKKAMNNKKKHSVVK